MQEKIKRNGNCKFTILEEKQMIDEYQSGMSMQAIATKYNWNPASVQKMLKAYNIPTRNLSQARRNYLGYTLNENSFEKIDSPDKAYWLGVMYSDGFISTANDYTNYFGISVHEKDEEWLEKFKEFLNYNGEIKHYSTSNGYKIDTPYVRLLIGNNKIVQDLQNLGVVEHKSKLINKLPDIPFLDDFIRGYIDGDGSLRKDYPCFQISGNKDFLLSLANYLKVQYNIRQDKTIYCLSYNTNQSRYLEKRLYKDAHYYLKRKYDIASRSFNSPLTLEDVKEKSE